MTRDFNVSYAEPIAGVTFPADTYALKLTPRIKVPEYEWLILVVDKSFKLQMLVARDFAVGHFHVHLLESERERGPEGAVSFTFTIPRGADVHHAELIASASALGAPIGATAPARMARRSRTRLVRRADRGVRLRQLRRLRAGKKAETLEDYDLAVVEYTKAARQKPDDLNAKLALERARQRGGARSLREGTRLAGTGKLGEKASSSCRPRRTSIPGSGDIQEQLRQARNLLRSRVQVTRGGQDAAADAD